MAISLTTLNGTDSIASSRITINDNFTTASSAINSVLSIVDIATGFIDNTEYGSNNSIKTENLTATSAITLSSGNLTLSNGNIITSGSLQLGAGTNVSINKNSHPLSSGSLFSLNVSGSTGITGDSPVGALNIPRKSTATYEDIRNPQLGSIVYDTTTNKLMVCISTSGSSGSTGTWQVVGGQTA